MHAVYASTSGNVEIVVERVAQYLLEAGIRVELHRAEQTPIEVFRSNDLFLLATSTWEHGVLNHFFQPLHHLMTQEDFTGKRAAFIGLGDNRYEPVLFNNGIEILRKTWLDNHGQQIWHNLKINGEPYHILDTTVKTWATGLIPAVQNSEFHAGDQDPHPVFGEVPPVTS